MQSLRVRLDDKLTWDALYAAHRRSSKSKGLRSEVMNFNLRECENLTKILWSLRDETYQPSNYRRFMVYDPKKRLVLALPYWDRIIHQWLIEEFIKPYYIPRFINDSFACIPERGTHAAADKIESYMRTMYSRYGSNYYIIKMDISKFFNNIDPDILFGILSRSITDPKLLRLIHRVIFDGDDHEGIPIGNYVSQYFANIYLNELDQFCKRQLHIEFYVRYMDDFIALAPTKPEARYIYEQANDFIVSRLNLKMNPKSRYYPAWQGLDFVGYRLFGCYRLLRKRSKAKLRHIIHDFETGVIDEDQFVCRAYAWLGYARHANSYNYHHKYLGQYSQLFDKYQV